VGEKLMKPGCSEFPKDGEKKTIENPGRKKKRCTRGKEASGTGGGGKKT